jgi:Icc protein
MTSASSAASAAALRPVREAGAPIHVVQITDFHLLSDPHRTMMGINTDESLSAVLDAVRQKHWPVDLLLLSGDLVQEPTPQAYDRLKRRLETLQAPCNCLPGNHDDPQLIREILVQGNITFESRVLIGRWQVICLDSTVPNDPGGYLSTKQLELLETLLADQPERYTLVCLHHSPLPTGSRWLDTMRLRNADELFALLDRHDRVKGLIFGHIHQALDVVRGSLRLMASPSTCFQFRPNSVDFALDALPPGYRWLKLYPNGDIETGVERLAEVPSGLDITSAGY